MNNKKRWIASCVVCLIPCLPAALWAQDYSVDGPETCTVYDLPRIGEVSGGYLVVPDGQGPYPLLVTSHGWSAGPKNQVGWARHFASYGFVAVVPAFPNPWIPNHSKNGDIIIDLINYFSDPPNDSPAAGKVDPERIGLEGHSAGGLASTLASVTIQPGALVLFDPVDSWGLGQEAISEVCSPVLSIFTRKSYCNNNGNWIPIRNESIGPTYNFYVDGATHCDGENESRGLCGLFCGGGANEERQAEFAHYATAFFLSYLLRDSIAEAELTEAALTANDALVDVNVTLAENCFEFDPPGGDGDADGDIDGDGDGDSGGDLPSDIVGGDDDGDSAGDFSGEAGCSCQLAGTTPQISSVSLLGGFLKLLGF